MVNRIGINPYKTANGYTIVYDNWTIKIITRHKIDAMDWVIYLPKTLIQFILEQNLPSPLKASILCPSDEVGFNIDAICFSPDEKTGFLTCKNLYYITK